MHLHGACPTGSPACKGPQQLTCSMLGRVRDIFVPCKPTMSGSSSTIKGGSESCMPRHPQSARESLHRLAYSSTAHCCHSEATYLIHRAAIHESRKGKEQAQGANVPDKCIPKRAAYLATCQHICQQQSTSCLAPSDRLFKGVP